MQHVGEARTVAGVGQSQPMKLHAPGWSSRTRRRLVTSTPFPEPRPTAESLRSRVQDRFETKIPLGEPTRMNLVDALTRLFAYVEEEYDFDYALPVYMLAVIDRHRTGPER